MEASTAIKPHPLGTRVCLLSGMSRGKVGYIRAHRMIERGGNRVDTPLYLVTEIMPSGPGVGGWWEEAWHDDVVVIQEARP